MIDTLRALNPDIKIIAYFPATGVWADYASFNTTAANFGAYVDDNDWWLYDDKGYRIGLEGYTVYTNLSTKCSVDSSGQRYGEWLAHYIADEIISTGLWDGLFIDNLFLDPTWLPTLEHHFVDPPAMLDTDRDGIADDLDSLRCWWGDMVELFLSTLRQEVGDSCILVANDKSYMSQYLQGGVRENFPHMHGGWEENMFAPYGYITMCRDWLQEPMNCTLILSYFQDDDHTVYEPDRSVSYERFLRFTLTSTLLGDGYYFLEGGGGTWMWWEDYYDLDIGNPLGDLYLDSLWSSTHNCSLPVWRREFDNATVFCNPGTEWIMLGDGTWLAPEDGRIESHAQPVSLDFEIDLPTSKRVLDQRAKGISYDVTFENPSGNSVFAYVWARLTDEGDTLVVGPRREFFIGAQDTVTHSLRLRILMPLSPGPYCLEVFVGGPTLIPTGHDTLLVTRIVSFDKNPHRDSDYAQGGSLAIHPQPVVTSDASITLEVTGDIPQGKPCSVRLYDVRGRLVSVFFEGGLDSGTRLEFDLKGEGGERIVPGLYFVSAKLGDETVTRKIVLLR
jgi:hypothetical protein